MGWDWMGMGWDGVVWDGDGDGQWNIPAIRMFQACHPPEHPSWSWTLDTQRQRSQWPPHCTRNTVTRQKDTPSHDKNININNKILGIILERNTVTRQKQTLSHDKNDEEKHTVTRQKTHHRKTKKHTDTRAKDHVTMARGKSSHDVFHEEEEPLIS